MGVSGSDLIAALNAAADAMDENRDALCKLDGAIGDADHGVAMALGFSAVREALAGLEGTPVPTTILNTAAKSFLNAVGASCGPLYATAFMRGAAAMKGKDTIADEDVPALIAAMADGIAHRGKASVGDKTMMDAWQPAADAAQAAAGASADVVLARAADAARTGAESTKAMQARLGRAARLGERSVGHMDPGAASTAIFLKALAQALA